MRVEVAAIYLDAEGRPLWAYSHGENVADTADADQNVLTATALLTAHLDGANASITAQSNADLKRIRGAQSS